MNDSLRDAIFQKLMFKPEDMKRYAAAAIYTALAIHPAEFGADDIPENCKGENTTTPGCAFALLKCDGIAIFQRTGRRASKSPGRHCAWINTYRLADREKALTWLTRNGYEPIETRQELIPT